MTDDIDVMDPDLEEQTEETAAEDQGHQAPATRVDDSGQFEMTVEDTPLFDLCEEVFKAKSAVESAKDRYNQAEKAALEELERINKSSVKHKGITIEKVKGRTTDDHLRFKK